MTRDKLIKIIKRVQQDPELVKIFSSDRGQPIKLKPSKSKERSKCKV